MSLGHGASPVRNGLVFHYDMANTGKSWKGKPTSNIISTSSLPFGIYAYASGPAYTTANNRYGRTSDVRRYTVTSAVNTARARIIPSLTVGETYTFSMLIKYNGTNTSSATFSCDASKGSPEGGTNNNTLSNVSGSTTALGNGWSLVEYTFTVTACPTGKCVLTYGVNTGSDTSYIGNTFDVYDEQFEVGNFATPYVNGTRSNTEAILDLTKNHTITANSLTYNSDGSASYNGSSNYISIPDSVELNPQYITTEVWFKLSNTTHPKCLIGKRSTYSSGVFWVYIDASNTIMFDTYQNSIQNRQSVAYQFSANTWYNITTAYGITNKRIYVNGALVSSGVSDGVLTNNSVATYIGMDTSAAQYWLNGDIDQVKIYNRALTDLEVKQNFEASRGRYGI